MPSGDDSVRALREAVRLSPDNLPLRQHLADTLLGLGHLAEAEFRQALTLAPDDPRLKLGLAAIGIVLGSWIGNALAMARPKR